MEVKYKRLCAQEKKSEYASPQIDDQTIQSKKGSYVQPLKLTRKANAHLLSKQKQIADKDKLSLKKQEASTENDDLPNNLTD